MSQSYAYLRISPKIEDIDSRIESLKKYDQSIELYIEKEIKGYVPLETRPVYQQLEHQLKAGDELILWWIDELGLDFQVCIGHLSELLNKGVVVKTINQNLTFRLDDHITDALVKMMKGYAESERHRKVFAAEMGRQAIKASPDKWKEKFRGRRCNQEKHQIVAQKLFEGKTLQQVADETDVSLSTVKRIKSKLKEHDELGHLRGKRAHRCCKQRDGFK